MSYLESGFNNFLERSIVSDPQSRTLESLPINYIRNMALDQLQVSGSMGGVMQIGGNSGDVALNGGIGLSNVSDTFLNGGSGGQSSGVAGGNLTDLTLSGDLILGGRLIVGDKAFIIDGKSVQLVINDGAEDIILLGKDAGAF